MYVNIFDGNFCPHEKFLILNCSFDIVSSFLNMLVLCCAVKMQINKWNLIHEKYTYNQGRSSRGGKGAPAVPIF